MKIDYVFAPTWPSAAAEEAARAQRLGFDGFFTADTGHEPFLPIAAAAGRVPDLDFGTAIAVAFARSPMVTAMTAWDLSMLARGRFLLGLGTQIKPHITRRFSMEWSSPGPRLREYIHAIRAIWNTWQSGAPLRFKGDYYEFTLMTPFFNPGPSEYGDVPVYIAGVGPYMARLAGEICDGYHVHPFHTVTYLREVTLPAMQAGADGAGRDLASVERASLVFVVTGRSSAEMDAMRTAVKQQIAFYASTPAYRPVLDVHGWDIQETLNAMSKRGEWAAMGDVITDDMVDEFAVVAPLDELGPAIKERYDGLLDRVGYYSLGDVMAGISDDTWAELVASTK
ncbi:MAG: TIGR03617 family F420-dependent LLM class oxidoreductase [Acidimicrobiia bacterium]|nr:TIGR03617 family F420-dependent LLM class oxidoreductase [Acidimicrobiia bacterium]